VSVRGDAVGPAANGGVKEDVVEEWSNPVEESKARRGIFGKRFGNRAPGRGGADDGPSLSALGPLGSRESFVFLSS